MNRVAAAPAPPLIKLPPLPQPRLGPISAAAAAPQPQPQPQPQERSLARTDPRRWEILNKIGQGASSEVHRVKDLATGVFYAAKISSKPALIPAIRKESSRLRRLGGDVPHLPRWIAYLEDEERALLVETLSDQTLGKLIETGPLPLGAILSIAIQILSSLEALAAMNYVHGDLKDENIGLSEGRVQLLDLGLLKKCERPVLPNKLQTIHIRSPECLLGHEFITPFADIWTLGCMLAQMTTNRRLFMDQNDDLEGQKAVFKNMIFLIGFPPDSFLEKCTIYQKKFNCQNPDKGPIPLEPESSPYANPEQLFIKLQKWKKENPNSPPTLIRYLEERSDCLKRLPPELRSSWIELILKMVCYENRISAAEALSICKRCKELLAEAERSALQPRKKREE